MSPGLLLGITLALGQTTTPGAVPSALLEAPPTVGRLSSDAIGTGLFAGPNPSHQQPPPAPATPPDVNQAGPSPVPSGLFDPAVPFPGPSGVIPAAYQQETKPTTATDTGAGTEAAPAKKAESDQEPKRRAMPSPFDSPPFPGTEYQGYPIIGIPPDTTRWPLMQALQGTWYGDLFDSQRIRMYGWLTWEGNWSTSKNSNTPDSYWVRPNNVDVDQAIIRFDRNLDSVQTDHIDWGFRLSMVYGIDYRYFTAGGWFSDQLLKHNFLYGFDPTEVYTDLYIPWVAQGMIIRVGRWIACPDIETQFSVDNYMGSHSLLFTFDTYTQTGVMATFKLSDQWTVQGAIHSGTDMAPWYKGAIPTGAFGVRWVSKSNNDAMYTWLNAINNARFRRFDEDGQPAGHDNFNYLVSTWEHRFNRGFITKTESYIMWQRDAVVGGTPSIGPVEPWGGGGGIGPDISGTTLAFGVLNFTVYQLNKRDFITFRNEWWKDTKGERSGFPGTYTSNAIGYSHFISPNLLFRPEIGFYRNWTNPAFDNGLRKNEFMCAFDFTIRF